MKYLFAMLFAGLCWTSACANPAPSTWNATELSDSTIRAIQRAQYQYKKCVIGKMRQNTTSKDAIETAASKVIKRCESVLAKMRKVYLAAAVPDIIADRHLRKMRTDISRRVIKQLMFQVSKQK